MIRRRCGTVLSGMLALALLAPPLQSEPTWTPLAFAEPTGADGRIAIPLAAIRGDRTKLRIVSAEPSLFVRSIVITSANEPPRDAFVRRLYDTGETIFELDLAGDGKAIRDIAVVVSMAADRKPRIAVLGHSDEGIDAATATARRAREVPADWVRFARATLEPGVRRTTVRPERTMGKVDVMAARLTKGTAALRTITLELSNGERVTQAINATLAPGDRTPDLLSDGEHFITNVVFEMDAVRGAGRESSAEFELVGRLSDTWVGPRGEAKTYAAGWVLLGTGRLAGAGDQARLRLRLDHRVGSITTLRLVARDTPAAQHAVEVSYSAGGTETVGLTAEPTNPRATKPALLDHRNRMVDTIDVRYRGRRSADQPSDIEVWGKP
jgi:hypothetical protein